MKKFFSIMLILVTLFAFASCGDGKESDEPNYPSIVGTWYRVVSQEQIGKGTMKITQTQIFNTNGTAKGIASVYLNDNLYQEKEFDYTYTFNGKTLKMIGKDSGTTEIFNVTISNNTMTMSGEDGTFTFTRK